mgnify:CR=1 FL=1
MVKLRDLLEVFSKLSREKPKRRRLCCPRCGSFKVSPYSSLDGWLTPTQYVCENCGYRGAIFVELSEE